MSNDRRNSIPSLPTEDSSRAVSSDSECSQQEEAGPSCNASRFERYSDRERYFTEHPEDILDCRHPNRVNQEFTRTLWGEVMEQACEGSCQWTLPKPHNILAGAPKGIQENVQEDRGISRRVPPRVTVNAKHVYAQLLTEAEGIFFKIEGYSDLLTKLCGLDPSF